MMMMMIILYSLYILYILKLILYIHFSICMSQSHVIFWINKCQFHFILWFWKISSIRSLYVFKKKHLFSVIFRKWKHTYIFVTMVCLNVQQDLLWLERCWLYVFVATRKLITDCMQVGILLPHNIYNALSRFNFERHSHSHQRKHKLKHNNIMFSIIF